MKEHRIMPKLQNRTLLRSSKLVQTMALATGALLLVGAKPASQGPQSHHPATNWSNLVAETPQGTHLLGDPAGKLKLTEYISYTCSHCAHFHEQSDVTLRTTFVAADKGSIEVVPYIRNPVDMAAALLVRCGGPARFTRLHDMFLSSQTQWMAKFGTINETQRQRWDNGPLGGRMRAMAADLGFYQMMESNGIDRVQADRCLTDDAAMKRIAAETATATKAGVEATPSFAINGVILTGTYDWGMLAPQLQARL
jgi:protein-disulfide isomerase